MVYPDIRWQPERPARFGKGNSRTYTRIARVLTDPLLDPMGPLDVCFLLGIAIGDHYESNDGVEFDEQALCVNVDPRCDDSPWIWIIRYDYEFATDATAQLFTPQQNQKPGSGEGGVDDPTQWAPLKSWDTGTIMIPMRKAYDDNNDLVVPVVNSAGYPFDPLPQREAEYQILTYKCYTLAADFDKDFHRRVVGATNSDIWLDYLSGEALLRKWQANEMYIGPLLVMENTLIFWFLPSGEALDGGWNPQILNEGTIGADGKEFVDSNHGGPVSRSVPMDAAGERLSDADVLAGNFDWLDFRRRKQADFNDLTFIMEPL